MKIKQQIVLAFLLLLVVGACQTDRLETTSADSLDIVLQDLPKEVKVIENLDQTVSFRSGDMKDINARLEAAEAGIRLKKAQYIAAPGTGKIGATVYFNDRGNRRSSADWYPFDPRRFGASELYYLIDQVDASGEVSIGASTAAIASAMQTWEDITCSDLELPRLPDFGIDWGVAQFILGYGGFPIWYADLTHAGFLPGSFFDALAPGGSEFILGVTLTFEWVEDIDNNGKNEVAFREIYYNDNFTWNVGSTVDIESIALHEAGHGLSQGHFGKLFQTDANGFFHFAPRAVMNAGYVGGVQTEIGKTDNAGHCSIWANWPNR